MPPNSPRVRNTLAKWVCKDLRAASIEPRALLKKSGITKAQIEEESGWITYEAHATLLEVSAEALNDPYFGINAAKRMEPREIGALAYVGLASKTLGDALGNLERYLKVQSEAWRMELSSSGHSTIVTSVPTSANFAHYPQATEAAAGQFIQAYQHFLGQALAPSSISFIHKLTSPRQSSKVAALLGCPVHFGRNSIHLVLPTDTLSLAIRTADDKLLRVLKSHCQTVLRDQAVSNEDISNGVRREISEVLSAGKAKAPIVARALGLTERSLHRRLKEEGTTFGTLLDELRRNLAIQYLQEKHLSGKQIAFLLGYSNQSAFGSAFRRWTGHSPFSNSAASV